MLAHVENPAAGDRGALDIRPTGKLDYAQDTGRSAGIQPWEHLGDITNRVLLELKHARLRLQLAATTIDWAVDQLKAGNINARAAITLLNEAMDELCGDAE